LNPKEEEKSEGGREIKHVEKIIEGRVAKKVKNKF